MPQSVFFEEKELITEIIKKEKVKKYIYRKFFKKNIVYF